MAKNFLVGSKYWFGGFNDFNPHDEDCLSFNEKLEKLYDAKNKNGVDYFIWGTTNKDIIISESILTPIWGSVSSLINKDVAKFLNITINDIHKLEKCLEYIPDKWEYIKILYNFVVKNKSFDLTDEQINIAYINYKSKRKDRY